MEQREIEFILLKRRWSLIQKSTHLSHLGEYRAKDNFLADVDFVKLLNSSDIEYIWSVLKNVVLDAIDRFVSKFCRSHRLTLRKWITPNLRNLLHKLHSLRKQARKSSSKKMSVSSNVSS